MTYRNAPLLGACALAGALALATSAFAQSGSTSGTGEAGAGYSSQSGMTGTQPTSNSMTRGQSGNRTMNGASTCTDTSSNNPGTSSHARPGCRPSTMQKSGAGNQGQGGTTPH